MRTNTLLVLVGSAALTLSGCAQTTGYRPVVDYRADPRAQYLSQDMYECEQIASENANTGKNVAVDGVTGALLGAAGGAVAGAFLGNPGIGAAAGAAAGGLGGAAYGGFDGNADYKSIYNRCMEGRGHRVLNY